MRYFDRPGTNAKAIAIDLKNRADSDKRMLQLRLILMLAGIVTFVLAGTYPAGV